MKDKNKAIVNPGDRVLIPAMVSGVNRGTNGQNLLAFPIGTDGKPMRDMPLEVPATSTVKGTIEGLTPPPAPVAKPVRKIAVKPGEAVELDETPATATMTATVAAPKGK